MNETLINFVEFDENPFTEGFEIYFYECLDPDKIKFQDIGYLVRILREKNKSNPIFHYGKNIYSLFEIKQNVKEFETKFKYKNSIHLCYKDFDKNEIRILSEMMLGTMIINKLMRDPSSLWKISESTRYSFYEIIKFQEEFSIGIRKQKIAIYPGFIIKPSVIRPNRIGFFIDCRTKMFHMDDLSNKNLIRIIEKSNDKYLIDFCPNNMCHQMRNPFSLCVLSSPRGGRKFVTENDTTSSQTFINKYNDDFEDYEETTEYIEEEPFNEADTEDWDWDNKFTYFDDYRKSSDINFMNKINLIDYHKNNYSICPEDQIIDYLDPDKKSIKVIINSKFYDFPPERLKPKVSTSRMNRNERTYIMNELILAPHIRLKRIINFSIQSIKAMNFNNIFFQSSNPIYFQKVNPIGKIKQLNKYELILFSERSFIPANQLPYSKPFDYTIRNKKKLNIVFLYFGNITIADYEKLKSYKWEDEIKSYFSFEEVIISNFNQNWQHNKKSKELFNELKKYDCIVLFHGNYDKLTDYEVDIINLIYKEKIPNQGLTVETFIEKFKASEYNYFRNILLGIYSKCGFIPWKIRERENENEKFIGLNIKSSQVNKNKMFSISLYSDTGILEKIFYKRTSIEDFSVEFKDALKKIIERYIKINSKLKLYVLYLGKSYEDDRKILVDLINEKKIELLIFEIYKNSSIRLFDEIRNLIKQVKVGTCYFIPSENEAYFSSIEPKLGTSIPTKIKYIPENSKKFISEDDIQKIFDLTQCYTGYVNYRIKLPLPVYAVEKTLNELKKIEIEDNTYECEKPFFI